MILQAVKADLAKLVDGKAPAPVAAVASAPAAEGQAASPAVEPRPALLETNFAQVGYHLDVVLTPATIVAGAEVLDRHGFTLETVTGVDWISEGQIEVVYDFTHYKEFCRVVLRARTDRTAPEMPTLSGVYAGADWHERETHDFFGVRFVGLENLTPFILPEDATFHPLRKDFSV